MPVATLPRVKLSVGVANDESDDSTFAANCMPRTVKPCFTVRTTGTVTAAPGVTLWRICASKLAGRNQRSTPPFAVILLPSARGEALRVKPVRLSEYGLSKVLVQ